MEDLQALKRTRGGRERLLTVAAEMFRSKTLAGTSLQMIADRLSVSKAAIYHHFRSRDEIVAALMAPVFTDAEAGIAQLRALAPDERPAAARAFYTGFVVRHRAVITMVFFDRGAFDPDTAARVDRLADDMADTLGDQPTGQVRVYGIAALITRHQDLTDEALTALVQVVQEKL
ncbi:helix-turn-helix domain-containing protein [Actinoplanes sp. NPDC051851]|uniref:TetR/AcrR family transcriptional regulator n=1 Tax=Actinoplanes sp. NPDC051851 TaxID=3154753 RepID=UPI003420B787